MFCSFEDAFFPSNEKQTQWEQTLRKIQTEAIENKQCWMCKHTYLEPWNNHGHEDHTRHCKFTNKCVDFKNGRECQNWDPRAIV